MPAALDAKYSRGPAVDWRPVIVGLLLLYVPTGYDLATGIWGHEEFAHGPIIAGVVLWLVWVRREALLGAPAQNLPAAPAPGLALLALGLMLYVLGRSQDITLFEVGSLAPVLAGVFLAMRGWPALRALWFPILFIVFMVPLPGLFVDALSGPLKVSVSAVAEEIFYAAGYPIARTGVVLAIGPYQLLVEDACSGLNSMFSLLALGLLYLHLMRRRSWLHNGIILASLLPIAFAANIARVLVLIFVTYHFGDAAGQGFLHGGAGILMLTVALIVIFLLDAALARVMKPRHPA
jgi:exosortase B